MTMQADDMRILRKEIGWSQQELADELGMSRKSIVEMEGGKAPIERRTELAVRMLEADPSSRLGKADLAARGVEL